MIKLPRYEISIESLDGEELGMTAIAYTSNPAIVTKGLYFNEIKKELFFVNELKMRVAAPAMIPDLPIYRKDDEMGEYEVVFTKDVIEQLRERFMLNKGKEIFNLDHNSDLVSPSFILDSWITGEPETDPSFTKYGVLVPEGTWFVVSQFTDEEYFKREIIGKDRIGYSIEGMLNLKFNMMEKEIEKLQVYILEPNSGESEEEYVARCIPNEINNGMDQDQAVAVCYSKYKEKNTKMEKQKFAKATLEDGTVIYVSAMEVGGDVMVIDENGDKVPVFDAEHILSDGTTIVTVAGKITEIKPKAEMAEALPVNEAPVPVAAAIDEAAVIAIIQPKLDEIYRALAEIKTMVEADASEDVTEDVVEEVVMKSQLPSLSRLFSAMKIK